MPEFPAPQNHRPFVPGLVTNRRTMLKGIAAGVAGIGAVPLLSACTGASSSKTESSSSKSTTLGSSASDAVPKNGIAAMVDVVADGKRHDLARAACAWGLGVRKAKSAIPALATALADNRGEAQRLSAWALAQIGDKKALPDLIRAYFTRDDAAHELWRPSFTKWFSGPADPRLHVVRFTASDCTVNPSVSACATRASVVAGPLAVAILKM